MVFVFIGVGQAIIVEFGGDALKVTRGGLHGYHWLIAVILGMSTWVASFLFKLLPDTVCPAFGKKSNQTDDEDSVQGKAGSGVLRKGSSLRGKLRGSFRNHSKQGSLRAQGNADRYVMEKPGSQRKQQSGQNLAPLDKEYK